MTSLQIVDPRYSIPSQPVKYSMLLKSRPTYELTDFDECTQQHLSITDNSVQDQNIDDTTLYD